MLESAIVVVHLLAAIGVVSLVLIQRGKGAEAGASFGAGASATVFGGQGSATFLSRVTGILAAVFFATSLSLAYFAKQQASLLTGAGIPTPEEVQQQPVGPTQSTPAKPDAPNDDVPVIQESAGQGEAGGDRAAPSTGGDRPVGDVPQPATPKQQPQESQQQQQQ